MKRIAIIILGMLRFKDKRSMDGFIDSVKGCDLFISTYEEYKDIGLQLSKDMDVNLCYVDKKSKVPKTTIWQWLHLDNVLKTYGQKLSEYEYVIKLRTDIIFDPNILKLDSHVIEPDTLYACTDLIFYASSRYFIKVFESFYDEILGKYYGYDNDKKYFDINYGNILRMERPGCAVTWLIMPGVFHKNENNFNRLKQNIKKYDHILDDPTEIRKLEMHNNVGYRPIDFSSEKIFALHCINKGPVEKICSKIKLYPDRKLWKPFISA